MFTPGIEPVTLSEGASAEAFVLSIWHVARSKWGEIQRQVEGHEADCRALLRQLTSVCLTSACAISRAKEFERSVRLMSHLYFDVAQRGGLVDRPDDSHNDRRYHSWRYSAASAAAHALISLSGSFGAHRSTFRLVVLERTVIDFSGACLFHTGSRRTCSTRRFVSAPIPDLDPDQRKVAPPISADSTGSHGLQSVCTRDFLSRLGIMPPALLLLLLLLLDDSSSSSFSRSSSSSSGSSSTITRSAGMSRMNSTAFLDLRRRGRKLRLTWTPFTSIPMKKQVGYAHAHRLSTRIHHIMINLARALNRWC
ncbi:hypothetical protein ISCGN_021674 [Ixodes scapularis]